MVNFEGVAEVVPATLGSGVSKPAKITVVLNPLLLTHCKPTTTEWQAQRDVIPVYPLALFGGCRFVLNAKFLLTLHSSNAKSFLAVVIFKNMLNSIYQPPPHTHTNMCQGA